MVLCSPSCGGEKGKEAPLGGLQDSFLVWGKLLVQLRSFRDMFHQGLSDTLGRWVSEWMKNLPVAVLVVLIQAQRWKRDLLLEDSRLPGTIWTSPSIHNPDFFPCALHLRPLMLIPYPPPTSWRESYTWFYMWGPWFSPVCLLGVQGRVVKWQKILEYSI